MVVPPKHPKMIIFSKKNQWLLGTTILGNLFIVILPDSWYFYTSQPQKKNYW